MSANTRVLYVITDLLTGGVPLHLGRLCSAMGKRGYDCTVACLAPPGPVSELLQADGVPVTHLEARGAWDLRVIWRLRQLIRRQQPDLVHCLLFHANMAGRVAAALAWFPSQRLLCEIQTVEIERRWHLFVDGLTQGLCGWVIGNSSAVVDHLAQHARIQRHRLALVRGGIDVSAIEAAPTLPRSTWSLPREGPLLLWVGRLDPVKGLEDLIEAMVVVGQESK
ncbi:MAG: glycosyltransferase, partial [Planctomycetes bacterium]|nr:glycosyltransferase [Planctomycetota bacterium]